MKTLSLSMVVLLGVLSLGRAQSYVSPFTITLDPDIASWTTDQADRNAAIVAYSTPDPADWYTTNYGSVSYGPLNPQLYSASSVLNPSLVADLRYDRGEAVLNVAINSTPIGVDPGTWQRQRLLYAAQQLVGTHYQHLHQPTFDPGNVSPSTFPWSPVSTNTTLQTTQDLRSGNPGTAANPYAATYGSPQAGIDCTDFSAYLYNVALGIQIHSGTPSQITFNSGTKPELGNLPTALVLDTNGAELDPTFLLSPNYGTSTFNAAGSLDSVIAQLQAGDLLYMTGGGGDISHVVVWLGQYGTNADGSPSDIPLVISSHDNTPAIFDTTEIDPGTGLPLDGLIEEHLPPPGVHILPFTADTWFYQNFSVAMQIVPEPSTWMLLLMGSAALLIGLRKRGLSQRS